MQPGRERRAEPLADTAEGKQRSKAEEWGSELESKIGGEKKLTLSDLKFFHVNTLLEGLEETYSKGMHNRSTFRSM